MISHQSDSRLYFTSTPIDQVLILLHDVPWKEFGQFILAWKGIDIGKQVMFKAINNKVINIDLNVADCIKAFNKIPEEHSKGIVTFEDEE